MFPQSGCGHSQGICAAKRFGLTSTIESATALYCTDTPPSIEGAGNLSTVTAASANPPPAIRFNEPPARAPVLPPIHGEGGRISVVSPEARTVRVTRLLPAVTAN